MSVVDQFGNIVTRNLSDRPAFTRYFMRAGFAAQHLRMYALPDRDLLPSQQYLEQICMHYTRRPMENPDKSALVNLFMPCELLHAMDVYPLCSEGFAAFLAGSRSEGICVQKAEEMGVPDTYCSFHKALLGAVYTGLVQPPRFIAATNTVCDANFSTFNAIAAHSGIPKFMIDVPSEGGPDAVGYVSRQLAQLVTFMEDILGRKMKEERLADAIRNTNRAAAAHEQYLQALETRHMQTTATLEMYRLLTSHILMGTEEAARYYQLLAADAAASKPAYKKRLLWCHVMPFTLQPMHSWFSVDGPYQLLPTDLHYDAVMPLDPQHPLDSLAQRLLANHFNGKVDRRISSVLGMAKRLRADGAVIFCHWGCKASNGSAFAMRDALQTENIPAVVLDGDACDRRNMSEGQFITRMQAFFEVLEGTT